MKKDYDYLIVGAGLFGATFANIARQNGKRCLVIDKRSHLGGNVYCEDIGGIIVHKYGPHIFHTNDDNVWEFVNRFVSFNQFTLNPIAIFNGKLYNLPFNMHTFYQMWGVTKPEDAIAIIDRQRKTTNRHSPQNLEEQAISLVGRDVYEILIKGYTEKQWGRSCDKLPADIIKRLPVRYSFNNNYFNDRFQGIPVGGYNILIKGLLQGTECRTSCNFIENRRYFEGIADKIVYTGPIDEYFDYCLGRLEYRSLRFEQENIPTDNFQGNAIVNYTSAEIPYTRIVEHKWFDIYNVSVIKALHTVITREYPQDFTYGVEPYYPICSERNMALYRKYVALAKEKASNVVFSGRLGLYQYLDMDKTITEAITLAKKEYELRT
ncbi:UDP-galactopyranose mutase [Bacteroides eggerthii]|uniref:UDP-galactopyranose mutase n=1 Tax=Bacteroides eggerthii TaxID=28111 RepID=A0ABT7U430_9BACE|nr:UDP-galactopyranose mutase [Bacteroides eggerthii]